MILHHLPSRGIKVPTISLSSQTMNGSEKSHQQQKYAQTNTIINFRSLFYQATVFLDQEMSGTSRDFPVFITSKNPLPIGYSPDIRLASRRAINPGRRHRDGDNSLSMRWVSWARRAPDHPTAPERRHCSHWLIRGSRGLTAALSSRRLHAAVLVALSIGSSRVCC